MTLGLQNLMSARGAPQGSPIRLLGICRDFQLTPEAGKVLATNQAVVLDMLSGRLSSAASHILLGQDGREILRFQADEELPTFYCHGEEAESPASIEETIITPYRYAEMFFRIIDDQITTEQQIKDTARTIEHDLSDILNDDIVITRTKDEDWQTLVIASQTTRHPIYRGTNLLRLYFAFHEYQKENGDLSNVTLWDFGAGLGYAAFIASLFFGRIKGVERLAFLHERSIAAQQRLGVSAEKVELLKKDWSTVTVGVGEHVSIWQEYLKPVLPILQRLKPGSHVFPWTYGWQDRAVLTGPESGFRLVKTYSGSKGGGFHDYERIAA
ncbi:MAG: hypothetical protein ABH823_05505 [bacterium]